MKREDGKDESPNDRSYGSTASSAFLTRKSFEPVSPSSSSTYSPKTLLQSPRWKRGGDTKKLFDNEHYANALNHLDPQQLEKVFGKKYGELACRESADKLFWRQTIESLLASAVMAKGALLAHPLVFLSAGPAAPPPKPEQLNLPPKEEEQFMELIFPGFDGNTFIWNITLAQIAVFALTMTLGHVKANPTPCALYTLVVFYIGWRLVCPMMLHANMMHLFFNVFFQLRIGFGMENQFGRSKMQLLYFTAGVVGNLVSVMLDPFKLAVGASTAGFGLIGVWVAEIVMTWELLGENRDRTLIWILFMLVSVTSMSGMTPNMDLYGHFGGAFGGFLMALIMTDMAPEKQPPWYDALKRLGFVGIAGIFSAGAIKLFLKTPVAPLPDCQMASIIGVVTTLATNLGFIHGYIKHH